MCSGNQIYRTHSEGFTFVSATTFAQSDNIVDQLEQQIIYLHAAIYSSKLVFTKYTESNNIY